jgi:flagellar biosynthesis protein FliR
MELDWLNSWLATMPAMTLVLARIGALFVTAPILGEAYVPPSVKALLAFAIALILTPKATPQVLALDFSYILLVIRETVFGFSLGWLLSLYMEGVQMGGELINRHAGFNAAENFDPESNIGDGPIGDLLHFGAILLFLATDGHLLFIASLARSFEILPLGAWTPPAELGALVARGVSDSWAIALALSFPVLSAIMVLTLVEGVMTRAIPQINVMSVSFAVKILVSLGVLYSGLPAMVAFLGTVLIAMHGLGSAMIAAH